MLQEDIKKFEPFFGKWYIVERLGGGSYGDVYKIKREEYGEVYYSALKVLSIPKDKAELTEASLACGSVEGTKTYFDGILKNIMDEVKIMERLKGKTNIVSYEDHDIVPRNGGNDPGYDIFIRMELLEDLGSYAAQNLALFQDAKLAVKIIKDMCSALKLCHAQDILHRDIKPGNIFRSMDGDYKLGDFGIAKNYNNATMSVKGTYDYMAPEVHNHEHYDYRADIYSLGMVMYYMLNAFRGPFLPDGTQVVSAQEKEEALMRRMQGEELPCPRFASEKIANIIRKACAFRMENRYDSIEKMLEELEMLTEEDMMPGAEKQPGEESERSKDLFAIPNQEEKTVGLVGFGGFNFDEGATTPLINSMVAQSVSEEEVPLVVDAKDIFEEEEQKETQNDAQETVVSEKMEDWANVYEDQEVVTSERKTVLPVKTLIIAACVIVALVVGGILLFALPKGEPKNDVYVDQSNASEEVQLQPGDGDEDENVIAGESDENVQQSDVEMVISPVLSGEVIASVIERGQALEVSQLTAEFHVSGTDATVVPGELKWDQGDTVPESSGEYGWTFYPIDSAGYGEVSGTSYVTVLIMDTVEGIEAVMAIEDKKSLIDVDLSECGLTDLSILEGATNLVYISLDGNDLTSIEVLKDCESLEFLSLDGNENLSDVSPILGLTNLRAVFMDGTGIAESDKAAVEEILVE